MKKFTFLFIFGIALIAGCKKSSSTTYCYRCNLIQYGSQAPIIIDTVDNCVGFGSQNIVYQKGDSIIYQTGAPTIDTIRCFRYTQ